jgi:hypothetical protein
MPWGFKRFVKGGLKGLFMTKAQTEAEAARQQAAAEAARQQAAAEAAAAEAARQQESPYPPESIKSDMEQRIALERFTEANNNKSIRLVYINPKTVQTYFNDEYSLNTLISKVNNLWNNLSETDATFRYDTYLSKDPNFPSIFKTDSFRDNFLAIIPNKEGRKGQRPSDIYELYLSNSTNSVSNFNSKYLIPYYVSILNALLVRLPEEIAANEARKKEAEEAGRIRKFDEDTERLYRRRLRIYRVNPNNIKENEPLVSNNNNKSQGGARRSHTTRGRKSKVRKTRRNRSNRHN